MRSAALLYARSGKRRAHGAFSVLALPGLDAYWDPRTLGLSDTGAVATQADLSGNGHDLVQATGGNQPQFAAAGINGHAAVHYTPNGRFMTCDALSALASGTNTPFSVFGVFSCVAHGFDGVPTLWAFGHSTTNAAFARLNAGSSETILSCTRKSDGGTQAASANGTIANTTPFSFVFTFDGTTGNLYINGVLAATAAMGIADTITLDQFAVGALRGSSVINKLTGFQGEMGVCNAALGAGDTGKLSTYLAAGWGL